jgi:hypothetical protein
MIRLHDVFSADDIRGLTQEELKSAALVEV